MSNLFLTMPINVPLQTNVYDVKSLIAKRCGIIEKDILSISLHRQSIDARDKSNVHFVCSYIIECNKSRLENARTYIAPIDLLLHENNSAFAHGGIRKSCIVVGAGPAGLFLARYLTQNGVNVSIIERGANVEKRAETVKKFFEGGEFNPQTNVQFGLGGAGTFSDGKLTTGISSSLVNTVFHEFVRCGAPQDILTSALPHIGTDNLLSVVENMRDKIIESGGKFLFDTFVSDIIVKNGKAVGVEVCDNNGTPNCIFADCVALCCGHSSRELFKTLFTKGVAMQFKPFAVGLRIEHTRDFINSTQYGALFATHRDLGAASYKLANNTPTHGCYSFCMCPGGIVVPANSEPQTVVVNGMSNYVRNAQNSNSAIVVSVSKQDVFDYGFESEVLSGLRFQQFLEKEAYRAGGGDYRAPYQNVSDFIRGRVSTVPDIKPSYPRGVTAVDFNALLPERICDILAESLQVFDRKMKNFAKCGVLTGIETRTSSPVKFLRDTETLQSVNVSGLYPVGEGAGHAGGIVSSAVDGLRVACQILNN